MHVKTHYANTFHLMLIWCDIETNKEHPQVTPTVL